jgi:hypothetical protein
MASLYEKVSEFRKIFNLIIKYYTRVRQAILPIEEMWIFIRESIFTKQEGMTTDIIFEKFHKQMFSKEVLSNQYIHAFFKEIKDSNNDRIGRKQAQKQHQFDPIIENLFDVML